MVEPRVWKRWYALERREGEKESAYKARHVAKAKELYPSAPLTLAKHHNLAEALLIAHYILRKRA